MIRRDLRSSRNARTARHVNILAKRFEAFVDPASQMVSPGWSAELRRRLEKKMPAASVGRPRLGPVS